MPQRRRRPTDFGIFDLHGLWFVHGNLLHDLAAINNVEVLPWDELAVDGGPDWQPAEDELRELDHLADVICGDRLPEVRQAYRRRPVPSTITSLIDGVPTRVHLGRLSSDQFWRSDPS